MTEPEAMYLVSRSTFDAILAKLEEILVAVKRIPGGEPGVLVYTPRQAMKLLQISERTVYAGLVGGVIPGRKIRGRWFIPAAGLREWLAKMAVAPERTPTAQGRLDPRLLMPPGEDDLGPRRRRQR